MGACCSTFAASCSRFGASASFVEVGAEASVGFIFDDEQSPAKAVVAKQAATTKTSVLFILNSLIRIFGLNPSPKYYRKLFVSYVPTRMMVGNEQVLEELKQ